MGQGLVEDKMRCGLGAFVRRHEMIKGKLRASGKDAKGPIVFEERANALTSLVKRYLVCPCHNLCQEMPDAAFRAQKTGSITV